MSKHADRGKWAEAEARKWLEAKSADNIKFAYHRYPDARSARGALSPQPADFLVARWPRPAHLEVKETQQVNRLPKAKIGQYGKLKIFAEAGFDTYVLVHRSAVPDWVYLAHIDLFTRDECPPSFLMNGRQSFPTAAAALKEIFG